VDIESMRTFLSVARNRSISRAAQELYATQPTVSLRVKRIEQELGFSVFHRSWKGVELTPEGRHILPTVADYLFRLQTAKQMTLESTFHTGVSSILEAHAAAETIAVDEWLVGSGTARLIVAVNNIVDTHLRITSSAQLHSMIAHGICRRGVAYSDGIPKVWANRETVLWSEQLAIVHSAADPSPNDTTAEQLAEFFSTRTFILMDDPVFTDHSGVTGPMLDALSPKATHVVDHVDIMASLCMEPGNATIIPSGLCARRTAFNQSGISWSAFHSSWGPVPVVLVEHDLDHPTGHEQIHDAITDWANHENTAYVVPSDR